MYIGWCIRVSSKVFLKLHERCMVNLSGSERRKGSCCIDLRN